MKKTSDLGRRGVRWKVKNGKKVSEKEKKKKKKNYFFCMHSTVFDNSSLCSSDTMQFTKWISFFCLMKTIEKLIQFLFPLVSTILFLIKRIVKNCSDE